MFDFLCTQPAYDYGDKPPAPPAAMPGLLDGLGLSALWQAPRPAYVDQPAGPAAASTSPGLLCWLIGSPTPAYQTADPKPSPSQSSARQQSPYAHDPIGR
jgi:hypothetical protein